MPSLIKENTVFKKLLVGAALSLSTFAVAAPPHRAERLSGPGVQQNDAFDVQQGYRLLSELDFATARRDVRMLNRLDSRIANFINAELNESQRFDRRSHRETQRLSRLLFTFQRLDGRFDPRALAEKRRVLTEAVNLAERDLREARPSRFSRR
jgi:hypothetical protein